ncbi:MAG: hypothetical protein E6G35_09220, partial [Actinobacteria bacterium]
MTASSTDQARRGAVGTHARWSRWAAVGLVLVVFGVGAFGLWSAEATARAARTVAAAGQLSDDYQEAARAVAAEGSYELEYLAEPGPEVRQAHGQLAVDLVAALTRARDGDTADRAVVDRALADHASYLQATDRLFAAVDRGDADEVRRIGTSEVQPLFRQVRSTVGTQASEHRNQAAVQLVALRQQ